MADAGPIDIGTEPVHYLGVVGTYRGNIPEDSDMSNCGPCLTCVIGRREEAGVKDINNLVATSPLVQSPPSKPSYFALTKRPLELTSR